jgi:hypothetical protein
MDNMMIKHDHEQGFRMIMGKTIIKHDHGHYDGKQNHGH